MHVPIWGLIAHRTQLFSGKNTHRWSAGVPVAFQDASTCIADEHFSVMLAPIKTVAKHLAGKGLACREKFFLSWWTVFPFSLCDTHAKLLRHLRSSVTGMTMGQGAFSADLQKKLLALQ
jgi:hypothetical protein